MDLPVAHGILCRDEPACQAETGVLASSLDGIQKRMREHTIELRIRYDEVDPMGFVHHSNYLKFFEIGRTELLRTSGGCYRQMEQEGQLVVVVRVDCRYRRPAKYDDLIQICTRIDRVTAAKIIHEYVITRDQQVLVDATVTLAVIDREGKLQRVPQGLVDQYGESS